MSPAPSRWVQPDHHARELLLQGAAELEGSHTGWTPRRHSQAPSAPRPSLGDPNTHQGKAKSAKGQWKPLRVCQQENQQEKGTVSSRAQCATAAAVTVAACQPPGDGGGRLQAGMARSQRCHRSSGDAGFPNTPRSEGRRSPGAQRVPQPPLIGSQRLIGTFLPAWGLCQAGNLGAAGSRGLPCPRLGTERGQGWDGCGATHSALV